MMPRFLTSNATSTLGGWVDRLERTWMARRRRGANPGADANAAIRLVDIDGATFRVRLAGEGRPTVVFAPDPPNTIEHLDPLVTALAPRFGVVCFEIAGFGFSTPPRGFDFSIAWHARLVTGLLERLALGPYALAMPCVAGLAGAAVAAAHPSLVSHVIGVQTPGLEGAKRWARRVDRNRVLRSAGVGQAVVLATRKSVARTWFDVAVADRARRPEFVATTNRAFRAGATYPLATALQALERETAAARPPQPALLVWGERDRTHRDPSRDELSPGSRVVLFPGVAHFPDLEDVPAFAKEVTRFLGGR